MSDISTCFFIDYQDMNDTASNLGIDLNCANLLQYIGEGRFLRDAYAYVTYDPLYPSSCDSVIETLANNGYLVTVKRKVCHNEVYHCDLGIEMTIDVLKVCHTAMPDIVVLASNNANLAPLVREVRKMGIRVELVGFKNFVPHELILQSSGFINLNFYEPCQSMNPEPDEEVNQDQTDEIQS